MKHLACKFGELRGYCFSWCHALLDIFIAFVMDNMIMHILYLATSDLIVLVHICYAILLIFLDGTISQAPHLVIQQHSNKPPHGKLRPIAIHKLDLRVLMTLPISLSTLTSCKEQFSAFPRQGLGNTPRDLADYVPATGENHSTDKLPKSVSTNPAADNPWYTNSAQ